MTSIYTEFRSESFSYRVAALSKSYLTVIGINMQVFEIDRTILTCLKKAIRYGRTGSLNYRKALLLKNFTKYKLLHFVNLVTCPGLAK